MNTFKNILYTGLILFALSACTKVANDDISFLQTGAAPTDGALAIQVTNDNSGLVTITPTGTGVTTFDIFFGDGTATPSVVQPGKGVTHKYAEGTFTVKGVAKNANGAQSSVTKQFNITYRAPENVVLNPVVVGRELTVTATAKYAGGGFKVFFGDVPNEVPTLMGTNDTLKHTYANIGNYTIKAIALSGGAATTTSAPQTITIVDLLTFPITFESPTLDYSFIDFAGGNTSVINNPKKTGINTSNKVCQMIKYAGQTYGGCVKNLGNPINFTTYKNVSIKVYSPRVGAKMLFKVEDKNNSSIFYEKEVTTTVANAWEVLNFDFNGINTSNNYHNIVIIFDNGTMGDGSANFTFLFDDITLN